MPPRRQGTDRPEVSVLIPAYRRPDFLADALASVVSQEGPHKEVIVGDDGGGDIESIAASFPGVTYVRNPSRRGMAGNWTSLCDRASGEFLLLLMHDDRLLPGMLERCVRAFRDTPDVGVVFADHMLERQSGITTREHLLPAGRHERFAATLMATNPVAVSAALFRRAAWEEVRPLPDTAAADLVLWSRIAEAGWPFFYVDEPLMVYRSHPDSLSSAVGFRDDKVRALDCIGFRDARAEDLRARHLRAALLSRASARLARGDQRAALADFRRARRVGAGSAGRMVVVGLAARFGPIGRALVAMARVVPWRPWR